MMKLSSTFLVRLMLVLMLMVSGSAMAQSLDGLATTAATWLQRLDVKDGNGAWEAAAPALRSSTTKADFDKALQGKRFSSGAVKNRGLTVLQVLPTPQNEAAQIAVTFQVTFEKTVTFETAVLQRQANGQWLVSAYFLR